MPDIRELYGLSDLEDQFPPGWADRNVSGWNSGNRDVFQPGARSFGSFQRALGNNPDFGYNEWEGGPPSGAGQAVEETYRNFGRNSDPDFSHVNRDRWNLGVNPDTGSFFRGIGRRVSDDGGMDEFGGASRNYQQRFGVPYDWSADQPPADRDEAYRPGMDSRSVFERDLGGLSGTARGLWDLGRWGMDRAFPLGGGSEDGAAEAFSGRFNRATPGFSGWNPNDDAMNTGSNLDEFNSGFMRNRFQSPGISRFSLPDYGDSSNQESQDTLTAQDRRIPSFLGIEENESALDFLRRSDRFGSPRGGSRGLDPVQDAPSYDAEQWMPNWRGGGDFANRFPYGIADAANPSSRFAFGDPDYQFSEGNQGPPAHRFTDYGERFNTISRSAELGDDWGDGSDFASRFNFASRPSTDYSLPDYNRSGGFQDSFANRFNYDSGAEDGGGNDFASRFNFASRGGNDGGDGSDFGSRFNFASRPSFDYSLPDYNSGGGFQDNFASRFNYGGGDNDGGDDFGSRFNFSRPSSGFNFDRGSEDGGYNPGANWQGSGGQGAIYDRAAAIRGGGFGYQSPELTGGGGVVQNSFPVQPGTLASVQPVPYGNYGFNNLLTYGSPSIGFY